MSIPKATCGRIAARCAQLV